MGGPLPCALSVRVLSELPLPVCPGLGWQNSGSFLSIPAPPGQAVTQRTLHCQSQSQEAGNKPVHCRPWEEELLRQKPPPSQVCSCPGEPDRAQRFLLHTSPCCEGPGPAARCTQRALAQAAHADLGPRLLSPRVRSEMGKAEWKGGEAAARCRGDCGCRRRAGLAYVTQLQAPVPACGTQGPLLPAAHRHLLLLTFLPVLYRLLPRFSLSLVNICLSPATSTYSPSPVLGGQTAASKRRPPRFLKKSSKPRNLCTNKELCCELFITVQNWMQAKLPTR